MDKFEQIKPNETKEATLDILKESGRQKRSKEAGRKDSRPIISAPKQPFNKLDEDEVLVAANEEKKYIDPDTVPVEATFVTNDGELEEKTIVEDHPPVDISAFELELDDPNEEAGPMSTASYGGNGSVEIRREAGDHSAEEIKDVGDKTIIDKLDNMPFRESTKKDREYYDMMKQNVKGAYLGGHEKGGHYPRSKEKVEDKETRELKNGGKRKMNDELYGGPNDKSRED